MNLLSLMRLFTIRFRMLGAIGVVLGLLGLLGGAGMLGMFRIHAMSEDFMANSFAEVSHMAELRGEMEAIRQHEKDMIIAYEKPESVKAAHTKWLASLEPLTQSLMLILDLIRNSAPFRKQTSLNGFYQDNGEDADLLRLRLDLASQLYPQISGHKSRFAIRFMPLDSEHGIVPERFDFELACC